MNYKPLLLFLSVFVLSCSDSEPDRTGAYTLEVSGMKNTDSGSLQIVGEEGDYFGKLTIDAPRQRVFEVGLSFATEDSLSFIMPGQGGYLRLKKQDSVWAGKFKYFGLQADVRARRTAEADQELQSLAALKPLGAGIISTTAEESFPSFDSESGRLYFSRSGVLFSSDISEAGQWSEPDTLSISGEFNDSAPYLDPDFQSLIFTSNRPTNADAPKKKNLWLAHKQDGGWSAPMAFPNPVNIDSLGDYHGGISASGSLYFVSFNREGGYGRSDLYMASLNQESEFVVENLGATINTELSEADVYIDPEERFLLFATTGRENGLGADDIFISFNQSGNWGAPENLGPKVNSFAYEYGPWVDFKDGFLYFNSFRRGTSDIYRVPLKDIPAFEPLIKQ